MTIADIITRIVVGVFIFWLVGGFVITYRLIKKWDEGEDE